jgi:hypothetical protein
MNPWQQNSFVVQDQLILKVSRMLKNTRNLFEAEEKIRNNN